MALLDTGLRQAYRSGEGGFRILSADQHADEDGYGGEFDL